MKALIDFPELSEKDFPFCVVEKNGIIGIE